MSYIGLRPQRRSYTLGNTSEVELDLLFGNMNLINNEFVEYNQLLCNKLQSHACNFYAFYGEIFFRIFT